MATPGLLFAFSKPKAGLSEKDYNEWYSNHHIQDVVKCGLADLAIRYKNINPEAKWPYLAIYRLPDLAKLQDQSVMGAIPSKHDLLGEKAWTDVMDADIRPFIRTQTFEGQIPKDGPRGKVLRTVMVEPGEGGDEEFDEWYRKQHMDMLSTVPGFRRSTRYKLVDEAAALGHPRFIAMHEYDDSNIPQDRVKLAIGTEWSKKILGAAKSFDGQVWELINATGDVESKF